MPVFCAIVTRERILPPWTVPAGRSGSSTPGAIAWDEHFQLQGPVIQPRTAIGEVTARMLRLNAAERVVERRLMQVLGLYRKE
jgi:hypothetical protein